MKFGHSGTHRFDDGFSTHEGATEDDNSNRKNDPPHTLHGVEIGWNIIRIANLKHDGDNHEDTKELGAVLKAVG